jgi:pimeloyl-ACP methyl ester carboxylesterase
VSDERTRTAENVPVARDEPPAPVPFPLRPAAARPVRPVRKDEIVIEDRGLYVESWLPERRSRRRPLFLIHGELGGSWVWHRFQEYFASRGWEAHALNLRGHYWSDTSDDFADLGMDSYVADAEAAIARLATGAVAVGHGVGALICLKLAEQRPLGGLVLIAPALPAELREPPRLHQLRDVPDIFRRDFVGWQGLPEAIRRANADLTVADVLRIQHMMGAESGALRRDVLEGVPVDRDAASRAPGLVIGGGIDRWHPEADAERLAAWLGAEYQPFGAHSHFGLVLGEESSEQVAETVRAFLEAHRL